MRVAKPHRRDHIRWRLGEHNAIRDLPVIGGVGGVERAVANREAHFTFEGGFQSGLEFIDLFLRNFDALVANASAGFARALNAMGALRQVGHVKPRICERRGCAASGRVRV